VGALARALERRAFALGYRKHLAYYRLFGYAELEQILPEFATRLEPVPAAAAARFLMARLLRERDLHVDMLREAGRRFAPAERVKHYKLGRVAPLGDGRALLDTALALKEELAAAVALPESKAPLVKPTTSVCT